MNTRYTRVMTITWASGKPVKLHDIAKALRKLPDDAERRRIIDEYRNYDPMRAFADIARASHSLPARD